MTRIKVAVAGAAGRMGQEVVRTVAEQEDMELVGAVDPNREGEDIGEVVGLGPMRISCVPGIRDLASDRPQVLVDFTHPGVVKANAVTCLELGIRPVIGTTGMTRTTCNSWTTSRARRRSGCWSPRTSPSVRCS